MGATACTAESIDELVKTTTAREFTVLTALILMGSALGIAAGGGCCVPVTTHTPTAARAVISDCAMTAHTIGIRICRCVFVLRNALSRLNITFALSAMIMKCWTKMNGSSASAVVTTACVKSMDTAKSAAFMCALVINVNVGNQSRPHKVRVSSAALSNACFHVWTVDSFERSYVAKT